MEKHRFKTAEFAALCGVKKDTLLHYDHIGLLKPEWLSLLVRPADSHL